MEFILTRHRKEEQKDKALEVKKKKKLGENTCVLIIYVNFTLIQSINLWS